MKVEKFFDKKEKKEKFRTRFQLNGKTYRPVADSRRRLNEIVDELRARGHRAKHELPVARSSPTTAELFAVYGPKISSKKQKTIFDRASEKFLKLIPPDIKVTELKKAHFNSYLEARLSEKNKRTKEKILPETANKELCAISSALKAAPLYFQSLDEMPPIPVPKAKESNRRRERLVNPENELEILLAELRRPHVQPAVERYRKMIADDLEIRYETGLRRKEVARLEKRQYDRADVALKNVVRWKTGTITKFFPLTRRAVEIIERRLAEGNDSIFIFSKAGKPSESVYRTLKDVCGELKISYGANEKGGFVPHDLRHNFATEVIQHTDIETAKSLTGHTGNAIFTYLHTDKNRQREAMRKREGIDIVEALTEIYNGVLDQSIDLKSFIEQTRILTKN